MSEVKQSLPEYQCHKIVRAARVGKVEFNSDGSGILFPEDRTLNVVKLQPGFQNRFGGTEMDPGYFVQYKDGYQSWSPTKSFEEGYHLIDGTLPEVKDPPNRPIVNNDGFVQYRRKELAELKPITEDMLDTFPWGTISIAPTDKTAGSPKVGDMIARNPENHNDKWLVNEEYFKKNFAPLGNTQSENLSFGEAIEALKEGKHVAREGWNGKDMFLFLLPAQDGIPVSVINDPALRNVVMDETGRETFDAYGSIRMWTADKKVLTGWLASQTDMLADDWCIK